MNIHLRCISGTIGGGGVSDRGRDDAVADRGTIVVHHMQAAETLETWKMNEIMLTSSDHVPAD